MTYADTAMILLLTQWIYATVELDKMIEAEFSEPI